MGPCCSCDVANGRHARTSSATTHRPTALPSRAATHRPAAMPSLAADYTTCTSNVFFVLQEKPNIPLIDTYDVQLLRCNVPRQQCRCSQCWFAIVSVWEDSRHNRSIAKSIFCSSKCYLQAEYNSRCTTRIVKFAVKLNIINIWFPRLA